MAKEKEILVKENPVVDALKKLKEEEAEMMAKVKPIQEAISALEKILDKSVKKTRPAKEAAENLFEESAPEAESAEALN